MKKLLILLGIAYCCTPAMAQSRQKKTTPKVDSVSSNMKPATTPAGEPLTDTSSGYQKWEENKTDSSKFRPLKQPAKKQ